MSTLDRQVALVTGAGRGIGKSIVELFAEEGAIIAAAARTEREITEISDEINSAGGKAIPVKLDVRSEESIRNTVRTVNDKFGRIDILVNNAAVIALSEIKNTSTETWDDVIATNVTGVFMLCREVLPQMMERRSGRIINIGSLAGRRGYIEQGAYCASKHALVGLTKVLALETQPYGINVNMLSPGGVLTGLSSDLRASRGEPEDSPEWMTAEEVARAALYICSQTGAAVSDELVLRRFASEPWR